MNLHENKQLFSDAIRAAAEFLHISAIYIEKDYWITRSLCLMSQHPDAQLAIFKGGTSLSKAHGIGHRFSEDIDIAIANAAILTGNQLKKTMRGIAKSMTAGLTEEESHLTSKGSHYYKAIYTYPAAHAVDSKQAVNVGRLLVEINAFANPYPYVDCTIESFLLQFFRESDNEAFIAQYNMQPFVLKVLDKHQTMTEKIVSLLRFSLADHYDVELPAKIRHFYDLYFLMQDADCVTYLHSNKFRDDFIALYTHDRATFEKPQGWLTRETLQSPLLASFPETWSKLSDKYSQELSSLAFSTIPTADAIAQQFEELRQILIKILQLN